jgi:hypothetical protein
MSSPIRHALALAVVALAGTTAAVLADERTFLDLIRRDAPFVMVPEPVFNGLGWDLPDAGRTVQRVADAAPGGAFDPTALESLSANDLGYAARWHVVRYRHYGVDWDITGLHLQPTRPEPGLPTLVQIHGGSGNFYQFFVEPRNKPGFGQYLAQRMPVLIVTIPGNYRPGGWSVPPERRVPAYLLDRDLPEAEVRARNAMFTFSLIAEGVVRLIEEATRGPVLVTGHSTGGEIQFMLKDRLRSRMEGRSYGWGTGGSARLRREWADAHAEAHNRTREIRYRPITEVRGRGPEEYAGGYIGPFNAFLDRPSSNIYEWYFRVIDDPDMLVRTARTLFEHEGPRKAMFKQHLQDIEHTGQTELKDRMVADLTLALEQAKLPSNADEIARDYFANMRVDLGGYTRMIWVTSMLDDGHWDPDPAKARELYIANVFPPAESRRRDPRGGLRHAHDPPGVRRAVAAARRRRTRRGAVVVRSRASVEPITRR